MSVCARASAARPGTRSTADLSGSPTDGSRRRRPRRKVGPAWAGSGRPPAGTYTRRTAQAWLEAKLTDRRRGVGIPAGGPGASFADAAAEWYRHGCHERAWKPATRRDYRSALSGHLGVDLDPAGTLIEARPPFGDLQLDQITTEAIERWRASTPSAVRPHDEPAADVEPLRAQYDSSRFDFYTIEEVMALVRAADTDQDDAIYLTAALIGLRLGEVLALRVRDVDFEAETVRVLQSVARLCVPERGRQCCRKSYE